MCDSDEDEFLSASEGEYDESDVAPEVRPAVVEEKKEEVVKVKAPEAPEAPESLADASGDSGLASEASPVKVIAEEAPEPTAEAPEDPVASEEQENTSSSKESLLEEPAFSQSGGSTPASLSSEKQRLLEEVVKETLPSDPEIEETVPESIEKESQSSSNDTEKSQDDGGWDDFGVEAADPEPVSPKLTETEQKVAEKVVKTVPEPEVPKKEEKKSAKEEKVEKKEDKVEASSADDAAGWDDWDVDNSTTSAAALEPAKKESFDGWDDWSLVDQKKVVEAKKATEETDPWFQEQLKPAEAAKPVEKKKAGGWGWGGLVSAVGETLSSTIENSLGLPSAEEAARMHRQMQQQDTGLEERLQETKIHEDPSPTEAVPSMSQPLSSGFGMLSGLVSGGMDVLETIGKKTFEAVTVKDENCGRRRMMFTEDNDQNLSDVLKELREKQDRELPFQMGSAAMVKQTPDVASLFGRSEGMAHLEALEMLSTNRPKASPKFEREFVSALSSIDTERAEDGDFSEILLSILKRINLPYEPTTLTNCDSEIDNRLAWCDGKNTDELFADAVTALVDFTAASVQVVSKLSNLLLIIRQDVNYKDFINLCALLAQRVNFIASRYVDFLSISDDPAKADDLVTQLHVESSVAVDFIKQAHRLLTPMFQSL